MRNKKIATTQKKRVRAFITKTSQFESHSSFPERIPTTTLRAEINILFFYVLSTFAIIRRLSRNHEYHWPQYV